MVLTERNHLVPAQDLEVDGVQVRQLRDVGECWQAVVPYDSVQLCLGLSLHGRPQAHREDERQLC